MRAARRGREREGGRVDRFTKLDESPNSGGGNGGGGGGDSVSSVYYGGVPTSPRLAGWVALTEGSIGREGERQRCRWCNAIALSKREGPTKRRPIGKRVL